MLSVMSSRCKTAECKTTSIVEDYPVTPVTFNNVKLEDEFWLPRLKTQSKVTVPHALKETEPAVERLRLCGNILRGRGGPKPKPHRFISSDLYKVMEGAAYLLMIRPDPELEKKMDKTINIIADAQKEDGYLYVSHICGNPNPRGMGKTPYSWVVHSHELYNMGHMYEGAIAYYQATGKDKWLKLAEKSARHINKVFFHGDPNYSEGKPVMQAPGHEELELALCKLYRVTGKQLYLNMAKKFLDIRGVTYCPQGDRVMSPTYAQQHKPVVKQEKAVGHAVRAGYLYAAMADVSALTGDMSYARAIGKIWHNLVDTKTHIIGGLGATHGIEGFGPDYVLPNTNTYNETCAAVANVLFNFRMFLLHKDAKYFDVAEVALLNNVLAGVSISGDRFFYVNVLEADGIRKFNHGSAGRSPWFGCACCPSNISRLIPQVSGYMYAHTDRAIYLTLYGSSRTVIPLKGGDVDVKQVSQYPFDGRVLLIITPAKEQGFALKLRIPTWAREKFVPGDLYSYVNKMPAKWRIKVNGRPVRAALEKGFATIERRWHRGDKVELNLPMPVRFNVCDRRVLANVGRVAVTRGPLVYCAEEVDNDGPVQRFYVPEYPKASKLKISAIDKGVLEGVAMVSFPAKEKIGAGLRETTVELVPYYAWNNRGEKSMIVWFPQKP
ncbi:glycoside hydrolase family 127 protein [bacterium]|nr:glycoside hydrolase family 127 protein [bacterium]